MSTAAVNNLRRTARRICAERIRGARADLRVALRAIEEVGQMLECPARKTPSRAGVRHGELMHLIRHAASSFEHPFTTQHVLDVIGRRIPGTVRPIPKATVSSAMRRLAELGQVRILEEGRGRKHAVYVGPAAQSNSHEEVGDRTIGG
jgi:hypothetical protein